MLNDFDPESGATPVDYCFSILQNLSSKLTRRSYVIDLRNRIIYLRTATVPEIRSVRLEAVDFGPMTPVQILDLNVRGAGDVTEGFEGYNFEANRRIAEGWVRHVQEMFPDAREAQRLAGGYSLTQVDRDARYPQTSLTRSELATGRNRYGLTALFFAVAGRHLRALQSLLKRGANVKARDAQGQTPLGIAKRNQGGEINKCLRNNLRGLRFSRLLTIGRG